MKYTVHMIAFYEQPVDRTVTVPDEEITPDTDHLLERIFYYGQNDFQPQNCYSVSVGDVVALNDDLHMVAPCGFTKITSEQLDEIKALPQQDRTLFAYKISRP